MTEKREWKSTAVWVVALIITGISMGWLASYYGSDNTYKSEKKAVIYITSHVKDSIMMVEKDAILTTLSRGLKFKQAENDSLITYIRDMEGRFDKALHDEVIRTNPKVKPEDYESANEWILNYNRFITR